MAIDLLPFLQAVKQIEVPPSYTYEAGVGRYRDTKTGHFVARKTIERLLNDTEAATGQTLRALTQALAQHRLDAKAWHLAIQQQLGRLHVQGAALGAGGLAALSPAALRRIEDSLRSDWDRLFAFGADVEAGALSEKQIANRINMYIGHARLQYYAAQPQPVVKAGHVVLGYNQHSCGQPQSKHPEQCVRQQVTARSFLSARWPTARF